MSIKGFWGWVRMVVLSATLLTLSQPAFASLKAEVYTLKNGLTVALIPNHKAPVVSHMMWYKSGAKDEPQGKSGVAHFLEHLMFKGTAKYGPGIFSKEIARFGGNDNAFTSYDFTAYFQNIAKDKLELVMDLESDRMGNLLFDEEAITKERQVILEERNMRIENNPEAQLSEQMKAALFQNYPYGVPVIGWKHEVADLGLADARKFYLSHYAPNNAILVISGDIDPQEIKPLVAKYYEHIKPVDLQPHPSMREPEHLSPIRTALTHPNVSTEKFARYYLAPSQAYVMDEDKPVSPYALTLLSRLLGETSTSRLYQSLVEEKKVAVDVSTSYDDLTAGPSAFAISAVPVPDVTLPELEKDIDALLGQTIQEGFSDEAIKRAKSALIADTIYAQEDFKSLAYIYGQVMSIGVPPSYVTDWEKNISKVTNKDIKAAAAFVLNDRQSVTGYLLPVSGDQKKEAK